VINFGGNEFGDIAKRVADQPDVRQLPFRPWRYSNRRDLIDDVTIAEGDKWTQTATFTVTRIGATTAFSVDYQIADGTATIADSDYSVTAAPAR